MFDAKCREYDDLKNSSSKGMESTMREWESRFRDMEGRYNDSQTEITRLNTIIKDLESQIMRFKSDLEDRMREINDWKTKFGDLEGRFNRSKSDWELEHKRLQDLYDTKCREFDDHKANSSRGLDSALKDWDTKYKDLEARSS